MTPFSKQKVEGRQLKRPLWLVPFFFGLWMIPACQRRSHTSADKSGVEYTINKQRDFHVGLFRKSGGSLSLDSMGAHFRIGPNVPQVVVGDPQELQGIEFKSEFTVSMPGDVFYRPDNHSLTVFTIKQITANKVVIGYQSTFDHRSFGKDLVTEDVGEFTLQPFDNP